MLVIALEDVAFAGVSWCQRNAHLGFASALLPNILLMLTISEIFHEVLCKKGRQDSTDFPGIINCLLDASTGIKHFCGQVTFICLNSQVCSKYLIHVLSQSGLSFHI